MYCPVATPAGTVILRVCCARARPSPRHFLHGEDTDERSDPNSSPIYFSSRFGRIYGVGRRIEYRNSQSYEYLRITSYR